MKIRKLLILVLVFGLLLTMSSCTSLNSPSTEDPVAENICLDIICNVYHEDTYPSSSHLCFDNITKIVYFHSFGRTYSGMSPYLAPNGQPYTYNKESNSLIPLSSYPDEEIPEDWIIHLEHMEK